MLGVAGIDLKPGPEKGDGALSAIGSKESEYADVDVLDGCGEDNED